MTLIRDQRLEPIEVGAPIRAPWLNDTITAVNAIQKQIGPPKQVNAPKPHPAETVKGVEGTEQPPVDAVTDNTEVAITSETWQELVRSTSTVRVENPEDSEQYVDVERTDWVTFSTPTGAITLAFNN